MFGAYLLIAHVSFGNLLLRYNGKTQEVVWKVPPGSGSIGLARRAPWEEGQAVAQAAEANGAKETLRDLVNISIFLKKAAREARCAWTRADHDLYGDLAAQLDAWIAKQWDTTPSWVQRRRRSVETLCRCFDCQEYGDGARRHEEVKRKIEAGEREEPSGETPPPARA